MQNETVYIVNLQSSYSSVMVFEMYFSGGKTEFTKLIKDRAYLDLTAVPEVH